MDNARVERKMSEVIDWSEIKFISNEIEAYIGKMQYRRLDYTGAIRFNLDRLEEIFQEAKWQAVDLLIKEDDAEIDAEYAIFLPSEQTIVS